MTVLKELIKSLEGEREKESDNGFRNVYSHIIDSAKVLLEKEKQQIIYAFKSGEVGIYIDGKDYYEGYYEQ